MQNYGKRRLHVCSVEVVLLLMSVDCRKVVWLKFKRNWLLDLSIDKISTSHC